MSNRQVAKNAVYLYLRTIVTTIVGIYTSRVVLQTLGIEDYGLYNVVGGVVGLFGFINGAMSGSTSRFITFELGKGDKQRLHDTFNSAMIVHLIITGIVLILAETVGLWFLYNKLVIPESRMWAAQWVYQLSIISALLGVTQVPYDAVLIAHERFDVSAYISMFSTFAKLGILYIVAYLPYDNLVSYAILILLVTVFTRMFARFYCAKHFEESKFHWVVNKELLKPMLNFSGWEMFGQMGYVANSQGKSVLINLFYGVSVNAAVGISNTVVGAVNGMAHNIVLAFSPSITKCFASKKLKDFENAVQTAAVLSVLLYSTFSLPLIIEREYIFYLWLGNVPNFSIEISTLHLLFSNFSMVSLVLNIAIQSIGKNKKRSQFSFFVNVFTIVIMFCLLYVDVPLIAVFCIVNCAMIFIMFNCLYLYAKYTSGLVARKFCSTAIIKSMLFFLLHATILYLITQCMNCGIIRLIVVCVASIGISSMILFVRGYGNFLKNIKHYVKA